MTPRRRVLVVSHEPLEGQVAGTSIRALELARVLSSYSDVTLAAAGEPPPEVNGLPCVGFSPQAPGALAEPLRSTDVVLALPHWPPFMRLLRRSGKRLIFDLYVPQPLEMLAGFPGQRPGLRRLMTGYAIDRLLEALRIGHGFLCASEKQRDLLLGAMLAERLIDDARHRADPTLRSVLDVVPFGLPGEPPRASGGSGARGSFGTAIDPGDEVILWNGGLWPWLDADTAIRAVGRLAERRPRARLVFMGAARQVPAERAAARARAVAAELGLLDRVVFFNSAWVPYEFRADWLLEADCALSTHADHLETRFAFRTRLLDCFWTGLPVVCTGGDDLGALVEHEGLGAVVEAGDVEGTAEALERVLDNGRTHYAEGLARVAQRFSWPSVAQPLVEMVAGDAAATRAASRAPRAGRVARTVGYLVGRRALDLVGLRDWPRV